MREEQSTWKRASQAKLRSRGSEQPHGSRDGLDQAACAENETAPFPGRFRRRAVVRKAGLEPAQFYPLAPQTSASTNSATCAASAFSNFEGPEW